MSKAQDALQNRVSTTAVIAMQRFTKRMTAASFSGITIAILVGVLFSFAAEQVAAAQQQKEESRSAAELWQDVVAPVIQNACMDCHEGQSAEGALDLSAFRTLDHVVADRRQWVHIATRIRDRQMPPADGPSLSEHDRRAVLNWIDNVLPTVACNHRHHAGPVTIRRLTRYHYSNTIRDLLGVEYKPAASFPADEIGYGFDNIGDVLSVSPLLLERYLAAAEEISRMVIVDPATINFKSRREPNVFGAVRGGRVADGGFMVLTTNAAIAQNFDVPSAGEYDIATFAFANQAGNELARLAVRVNGVPIDEVKIHADHPDDAQDLKFSITLKRGKNLVELGFTNDYYNPKAKDRRQRDRNLAIGSVTVTGPREPPEPAAAEKAFLFVTPGQFGSGDKKSKVSPRQCAEQIIARHATRAFRRELNPQEKERLLELFDLGIENGESFQAAMQLVLQGILVSPHFLYRVEAPAPDSGTRFVSDYELATSLSYSLWSTMPDQQLFEIAARGLLSDPVVLKSQVLRMLKDPKSAALVDDFASQWLKLPSLEQIDPDPELFPGFSRHLRESMLTETRMLLADVIGNDLPLTTLLTADYTYVNKSLAAHYGLKTKGLRKRKFTRVSLNDTQRQGLLSHASFLTLTSNPTRTSPVKRGKWILENLLADPPPPALPDVPQLDSQQELKGTLRQRMLQHRADPNCASCHYKMDTLGFAFERFDSLGKYRTRDGDQMIDSAGELPGGEKFDTVGQLQNLIAKKMKRQFVRCIVEKFFVYCIGRGPLATDDCIIDDITTAALENDLTFSGIVLELVNSQPFLQRSGVPQKGRMP